MRNSSLFVLFGSLLIVAFVPRCGDGTTDCTQTSTCPSDASDGPPPLTCDTTKDPKDAPGCLDDRVGVFVDGALGKDANPGTKELPFQTIGKALTGVGALTRVYVCEGTYSEDVTITPPVDGMSIYGGFKCADWTYSGNKPTVGKSQIALTINGTTKPIAIEDFLIKSADGGAGNASSIAALVSGATAPITFTRVNLTAGVGVAATDAAVGSNWTIASSSDPAIKGKDATGAAGGPLQTCANLCTDTNTSTGGSGGQGTTSPGAGSDGTPNLGAGKGGTPNGTCNGGNGNGATTVGADATSPAALGTLAGTGWTPGSAAAGKNGTPGQGGGGGAGQSQSNDGGGGGGACGGCGGGGGGGGSGGGSSIALAVVSSSVTVNASELHAGDAGNGGKGAAGQVGQTGGAHGNGSGFGCSGGNGGSGAAGGTGAGGVGGISVGVLYKGSQPTVDGATTTATTVGKAGTKGVGGTAGTNDGMDGIAQPSMQAP
jgi:hypothetical protein